MVSLQLIIFDILKPFESNFWKLLENETEIMAWVFCHNIDCAYQTKVMLLLNFLQLWVNAMETWPCEHKESTFYLLRKADATLVQRRNMDIEKTL